MSDDYRAQLEAVLRQGHFQTLPELPEDASLPTDSRDKKRLSRALAAFALENLASITPIEAVRAVVDRGNDNGIDAIYFDRTNNCLWLIQSKYGSAPDMADNKKFCDGIRDLQAGRLYNFHWGRGSPQGDGGRTKNDVEMALDTDGLRFIAYHVFLENNLGDHAKNDLAKLETELNQYQEQFSWNACGIQEVHAWLTQRHAITPPDVSLVLSRWQGITGPRKAFYGLVDGRQLALLFESHGKAIFENNIRYYVGGKSINKAIAKAARERSQDFFYLNNGLTAICSNLVLAPRATPDAGRFSLSQFSIVNGAQTLGSIYSVYKENGDIPAETKVLVTIIEVKEAEFGKEITRARNTQNPVRILDFSAQDPKQEQLRRELAISNIKYLYRPSDQIIIEGIRTSTIKIESAASALACFSGNTRIAVAAKKEIGSIFDPDGEYYKKLFVPTLSGLQVCRLTRIFFHLQYIFVQAEWSSRGRQKAFYRHGLYFVLHILARRHRPILDKAEIDISDADRDALTRICQELAEVVFTVSEAIFPATKGYLSIFRNLTDSLPLADAVMKKLNEPVITVDRLAVLSDINSAINSDTTEESEELFRNTEQMSIFHD